MVLARFFCVLCFPLSLSLSLSLSFHLLLFLLFQPHFLFFFLSLLRGLFFSSLYTPVCPGSGTLNDTSGTFQSPGYPSAYHGNVKCSWKIVAPSGYVVKLTIKDMDLQSCYSCSCDSVQVYDGETPHDASLGKVCGNTRYTVLSSDIFMHVRFSTDVFNGGRGFQAFYSVVQKSEGKITKSQFLINY